MSLTVPPRAPNTRQIFLSTFGGRTRIGVFEDGALREVRFESAEEDPNLLGGIFLGRVVRVVPSLQAAFVDILPGVTGFLPARDARRQIGSADERVGGIETLCHEGEKIVVQVTAEPHSDKGPRLSSNIALAFEHLVFSPARRGVLISSRIHNKAERARLSALGEDLLAARSVTHGIVLRTQASQASQEVLNWELVAAATAWSGVENAMTSADVKTQLYTADDAIDACLKAFGGSTDLCITDDRHLLRRLEDHFKDRPGPHPDLRLAPSQNLFEDEGLDDAIDAALAPRVALPGGGWISFGETEALTAIDVNTGTDDRSGSAATLALRTNEEAAVAVARQVRLRNLSGLFVIDFVEMKKDAHQTKVRQMLADELGLDPSPCRVGHFSAFGLLDFTRQRPGKPLSYSLS